MAFTMMTMRLHLVVGSILCAALMACSADRSSESSELGVDEAGGIGGDAAEGSGGDAGSEEIADEDCESLTAASTAWVDCPETSEDLEGWVNDYGALFPDVAVPERRIGECGGLTALDLEYVTHRQTCLYDPSAHSLVAAEATDDVASFCDNTRFSIRAGTWPEECTWEALSEIPVEAESGI